MLLQQASGFAQQQQARYAFHFLVAAGEMLADITQRRRAEQGIDDSMGQDIAVGMAGQAALMWNLYAPQHQGPSRGQLVGIIALTDADAHSTTTASTNHSAGGGSAGGFSSSREPQATGQRRFSRSIVSRTTPSSTSLMVSKTGPGTTALP